MTLMSVEYWGPRGYEGWILEVKSSGGWSATSLAVGGMEAAFAELVLSGALEGVKGVVYPEDLAAMGLESEVLRLASERGLELRRPEAPLKALTPMEPREAS
jgi:hypothetical protein